jgi:hypothetical protein
LPFSDARNSILPPLEPPWWDDSNKLYLIILPSLDRDI